VIEVTSTVTGAAEVQARFETLAGTARPRFLSVVQRLGLLLLRKVKEEKLSGQVLNVRTGRLRRSIHEETTDSGEVIQSTVGTPVVYGRAWELGFEGMVSVRAHVRTTAHGIAQVRTSMRTVRMTARPFLQPALVEMRPQVLAELQAAAGGADAGA
jgi:phage gpG-like protein